MVGILPIPLYVKKKKHYKFGDGLPEVHVIVWIRDRSSKENWETFFLLLMSPLFQVSISQLRCRLLSVNLRKPMMQLYLKELFLLDINYT